jgi:hypothetical protein
MEMKNKCKALILTNEKEEITWKIKRGEGILLKWMLVKKVLMVWTDIMWFRIGSNGGPLRTRIGIS